MSLFIATGTNQGDKIFNLINAKKILCTHFELIAESRIYESPAVDYLDQDDFLNQVLEFKTPKWQAEEVMQKLLEVENELGRIRDINKGPRIIDLDILFIDNLELITENLIIPHPRLFERSFVVLPLSELPGFKLLKEKFSFPITFNNHATPLRIDLK